MENLIEDKTPRNKKGEEDGEEKKKRTVIKSATDLQRLKLEKLMKNPEKPIMIPEPPKEKDYMQTVPSFVRNVMGSSAGAGSGEFHVYRHLRRKEYARQKCIQAKSMREQLDDEYQSKLEKNRLEAEAKTAKKRAKRLKKKQRAKKPRTQKDDAKEDEKHDTSEDDDDDEEGEEQSVEKDSTAEVTEGVDAPATESDVKVESSELEDKIEAQQNDKEDSAKEQGKEPEEKNEAQQVSDEKKDEPETEENSDTEHETKESTCGDANVEKLPI